MRGHHLTRAMASPPCARRSQKPVHALSRKVGGADGQPATSESGAAPAPPARSLFQSFLSRVKVRAVCAATGLVACLFGAWAL